MQRPEEQYPLSGTGDAADRIPWKLHDNLSQHRHRNSNSSGEELTFDRSTTAFGAQFDYPVYPESFRVHHRDLSSQTAPSGPPRPQTQVLDHRLSHTDGYVGQRHQNGFANPINNFGLQGSAEQAWHGNAFAAGYGGQADGMGHDFMTSYSTNALTGSGEIFYHNQPMRISDGPGQVSGHLLKYAFCQ
jgi:hypothetical protein